MAIIKLNNNALTSVTELPSGVGADPNVKTDLARLGLRVFANQNLVATNSNSLSYDVFQDSSGITNLTNAIRDDNEFIFSGSIGTTAEFDYNNASPKAEVYYNGMSGNNNTFYEIDNDGDASNGNTRFHIPSIAIANSNYPQYTPGNTGSNINFIFDYKSTKTFTSKLKIGKNNTWGDISQYGLAYSTDNSTYIDWDMSGVSQDSLVGDTNWTSGGAFSSGTSAGIINVTQHANTSNTNTSVLTLQNVPTISARYIKVKLLNMFGGTSNFNAGAGIFAPFEQPLVTSATGSFEGATITASSSTSKIGAVITYKDHVGTNALNSDLVLQLSADNGSNYSTATLTALPDFASGVKCCKVSDVSVTAGTQLKYKINFANQSIGSKECRVTGVSLQY